MSGESSETVIRLQSLSKSFGGKKILSQVDLSVRCGESIVIIGGSGSGKSVTIKCILGLVTLDSGSIHIEGQSISDLHYRDHQSLMRRLGVVFQGGALFDSLKIWENVAFGLVHGSGRSYKDCYHKVVDGLARVGLGSEVSELYPAELSGGMKKRVAIARAIVAEPSILFFDEPTTGLDPITADVINDLIRRSVSDLGATAITITHDMMSLRKIADRVVMLHDGHFIWDGPADSIDHSENDYVDQFVHGRSLGPIKMMIR